MIHLDLRIFFCKGGGGFHHQSHQWWGGGFHPRFFPTVASIEFRFLQAAGQPQRALQLGSFKKTTWKERFLLPPQNEHGSWKWTCWKKEILNLETIRNFRFHVLFSGEDNPFILVLGGWIWCVLADTSQNLQLFFDTWRDILPSRGSWPCAKLFGWGLSSFGVGCHYPP